MSLAVPVPGASPAWECSAGGTTGGGPGPGREVRLGRRCGLNVAGGAGPGGGLFALEVGMTAE